MTTLFKGRPTRLHTSHNHLTISRCTEKKNRRTNINAISAITLSLLHYILLREIPKAVMVCLFSNPQWISLASVAQSSLELMETSCIPSILWQGALQVSYLLGVLCAMFFMFEPGSQYLSGWCQPLVV